MSTSLGRDWIQEVRHDSRENADIRAAFFLDEARRAGNYDHKFIVYEYESYPK